jgi:peptide deformylase
MIEHNGLGLSANQVGLNKRMFVMETSKGVIDVINPHIVDMQGNMTIPEGCLSSPGVNEIVYTRPQEMTLEYQDRHGEKHVGVVFDFEAMCASHEIDHLNGIFWFSKLPNKKIRKRIEAKWDKLKK